MEKKLNIKILKFLLEAALNASKEPLDKELKRAIKQRLEKCSGCPLMVNGWCSSEKTVIVKNKKISGCGCFIPFKARSFDEENKCPLNKW
jgi:hypothetical protein